MSYLRPAYRQVTNNALTNINTTEVTVYTWTVGRAGTYRISATMNWENSQNNAVDLRYVYMRIKLNGTAIAEGVSHFKTIGFNRATNTFANIFYTLAVNDSVTLTALCNTTTIAKITASSTYFTAQLIRAPKAIT